MRIRLNKLLSSRGVAARRKCDELIESGTVRVNGEVITAPGARVDPDRDRVEVKGRALPGRPTLRYYMFHKPVGMISTLSDPEGRSSLRGALPAGARVFPIGRLDAGTSGLLLLTNDGELAHHLMHPRYGVEKFYRAVVGETPTPAQIERLKTGVEIEPGVRSGPARVRQRDPVPRGAVIEIAISEGRYRQVRRMCEAVGLPVVALHRWGYGPLRLGELGRGMFRELSEAETDLLRSASARPKARPRGAPVSRARRRVSTPPAEGTEPIAARTRSGGGPRRENRTRDEGAARAGTRPRRDTRTRGALRTRAERRPRPGSRDRRESAGGDDRPRSGRRPRPGSRDRFESAGETAVPTRPGRGRARGRTASRSGTDSGTTITRRPTSKARRRQEAWSRMQPREVTRGRRGTPARGRAGRGASQEYRTRRGPRGRAEGGAFSRRGAPGGPAPRGRARRGGPSKGRFGAVPARPARRGPQSGRKGRRGDRRVNSRRRG